MSLEVAKLYLDPCASDLLVAMSSPRKALFLDRDGVINVDHGYVHKPDDTEWMPGIFDLCAKARKTGHLLIVVTNQAGIARGYYSEREFLVYTKWMHKQFDKRGLPLIATYYCPHHPEAGVGNLRLDCDCRKPKPGLIKSAAERFQLDLSACTLVGDKLSDIEAGIAAGVGRKIMVESTKSILALCEDEALIGD